MTQSTLITSHFIFSAQKGGAWGRQNEFDSKGYVSGYTIAQGYTNEFSNRGITKRISPVLARAIERWQEVFEQNAISDSDYVSRKERLAKDSFDWDKWNKAGIRLAHLLKKEIGHLFDDFYYGFVAEDIEYDEVWRKTKGN